jgi:acetyl-CoA acetyltransferase
VVKAEGTVTAGNASGINDGAAALLIASDDAVAQYQLKPRAKIIAATTVGVEPALWVLPCACNQKVTETSQSDFRTNGCD